MNYRVVYTNELAHHGVKGMKWYQRLWQNYDGSLTPAGYIHYGYGNGRTKAHTNGSDGKQGNSNSQTENYDHASHDSTLASTIAKCFGENLGSIGLAGIGVSIATANPVPAIAGMTVAAASSLIEAGYHLVNNAKQNKKFDEAEEKLKESGKIDKKTGFYKKANREYTEEEDVAAINPGFEKYTNDTKNNCFLCTLTYDLRKRGYNVSANMASDGFFTEDLARWYKNPKAKQYMVSDEDWEKPLSKNAKNARKQMLDAIKDDMEKEPPGSSGYLSVQYFVPYLDGPIQLGVQTRAGHAMAYKVNSDGKVDIIDGQTNEIYKDAFNTGSCSLLNYITDIDYARLDNLEIRPEHIKEVAHS